MKKGNIMEMFKNQHKRSVTCPACGMTIPELKLNSHLDFECVSSGKEDAVSDVKETYNSFEVKTSSHFKNESTKNAHFPLKCETIEKKQSDSGEFSDSPNIILTATKGLKPMRSSSAPWRSQSTKRKYSKRSPDESDNREAKIHSNMNDPVKLSFAEQKQSKLHVESKQISNITASKEGDFHNEIESTVNSQESDSDQKLSNGIAADVKDENSTKYSPYYLTNFKHIINKVLEDEFNKHLFDRTDHNYIQVFNSMSDSAQKLYVRLFQRKYKWLRLGKINYPQIADDLSGFLLELVQCKLLDSGENNLDLEVALGLLSLDEIKNLGKHFKLNIFGRGKSEINQLLINHGKQHKSFFSTGVGSSVSSAILKRVRQIMGPCYRLALEPKRLFTRILMLYSLPTIAEDDEEAAGGQQQQLFTLLQVNKGELIFPDYNICRQCVIFEEKDDLVRYETARQLENDILNAIEAKKFELGKELYLQAESELSKLECSSILEKDKTIPPYLRRYTAGHVYIRCLNQGVEVLQKLRQYEEAVQLLKKLLNQTVYGQDRRGRWWDRMALNLEQHLKNPKEAVIAIKEGLHDKNVRVGHRLALLYRAERLVNAKKNCDCEEIKLHLEELHSITQAPKVVINGHLLPHPIPGRRHIFISSNCNNTTLEDEVTILSVEEVALEHYKNEGYVEGVHGEGSTFISLYTLFFWDIIYDGAIEDAFISPYQALPLDLNSDSFYERRQNQINSQLDTIRNSTLEELNEILKSCWAAHNGKVSLVSWDRFTDEEQVKGLVSCLGNSIIAGICERLSRDFRFTRSGVPDLVVWNPDTKLFKIVEVKGPGDKLSPKQILWLDYLLSLGADAEVCLVEAVGAKKLKK